MIPKKIHYCWFGKNEKPKTVTSCIDSWRKHCPDYEIIEWNEDNFRFEGNPYLEYCYEQKKWAFLSDLARLLIVYENGGIYFDTDVRVIKPIDALLDCKAFYGFENNNNVATGLGFGAEKDDNSVGLMIAEYSKLKAKEDGSFDMVVCPALNTAALLQLGLELSGKFQNLDGIHIYPADYFNPMNSVTGEVSLTENTISIHEYTMSWLPPKMIMRTKITRVFHRIFGENCFKWIKRN